MEHYIIDLPSGTGNTDRVFALMRYLPGRDDLQYDVYREGALLGTIYPAINECGEICWVSDDLQDKGLVEQVGEGIERQDR
jgi:hypothetical protein